MNAHHRDTKITETSSIWNDGFYSSFVISESLVAQVSKSRGGAEGGTRTPTGCPTTPSRWRVCQFHHFGTREKKGHQRKIEGH